jgi:hypothetical protein
MNNEVEQSEGTKCSDDQDVPEPEDSSSDHENIIPSTKSHADQSDVINYVKSTHGPFQVIENIIELQNQKVIMSIFHNYDLRFSICDDINIIKTPLKNVLPYLAEVGEIIFFERDVCLIQKDNTFFLVSIGPTRLTVEIFSNSIELVNSHFELFQKQVEHISAKDKINMELSWYYYSPPKISSAYITEEINDTFIKEAYPYLDVDLLFDKYLESDEPVMLFIGPPGTGKTRLIRYLLKKRYEQDRSVKVAFTSDQYVIESSEIFIEFLLGEFSTLVIEDIDYHLRPRKEGNTSMYNFLTSSNSIIINYLEKKKMILSTNLPDVKNIDDALLRPGRCFAVVETRPLVNEETKSLLKALGKSDDLPEKKYTIAEIFNSKSSKEVKKAGF